MAGKIGEELYIILDNEDNDVKAKSEENQNQATRGDSHNEIGKIGNNKIFVGGLPHNINETEFKDYFERFGRVTDSVIIHDKFGGKSRGFGFINFEFEAVMNNVLKQSYHKLNNRYVEVKRALPKNNIHTGPISKYGSNNVGNEYYYWYAIHCYNYGYYYDQHSYINENFFESYNVIGFPTSMLNGFVPQLYNNPWSHGDRAYYDPYRPRAYHDYRQLPNSQKDNASPVQVYSRSNIHCRGEPSTS